jgi:glycosyltransferase involved in cell wall biosynthesis
MSDSPVLRTGFATVTREILRRLSAIDGYEVACLGWGYDGWPVDRADIPYPVYPSGNSILGRDTLGRVITEFEPDVLVTLGDIWMVDWITQITERRGCRFLSYFPIDGAPLYQPWLGFLEALDGRIACSRFGQDLVKQALPSVATDLIYHGVDTSIFRPLPPARPVELQDRFIVGCTARNQPRKNLPVLIEAFARFCADKDDAVLYLHSDPKDVGWDLLDLLRRYDILQRTCISKSASITNGVSTTKLNEIYNLFDVMVLPTAGEGFGLPILEAMAAGVPVMATDYSACIELLEGRGELIAVRNFMTAGRHNVDYAIPDLDDLLTKLDSLYHDEDQRQHYSQLGVQFAKTLDWQPIVTQWDALLTDAMSSQVR